MTDAIAALRAGVEAGLATHASPWAGRVRELADGFSSVVFAVGDVFVVRVVTDAVAAVRATATVRLLREVAPHLPVPVPRSVAELAASESLPYGAQVFRRLPGRTLSTADDRDALAEQLAGFLTRLHTLHGPYRDAGVNSAASVDVALARDTVPALADRLSAEDLADLNAWRTRFLDWWQRAEKVPVHGDLWHENLLADTDRLTGVLDWEAARFAPRAVDLCGLSYLGDDFADLVTRRYAAAVDRDPTELAGQARLCRVARELEGVAWSLREDDVDELADSLDKLRAALSVVRT